MSRFSGAGIFYSTLYRNGGTRHSGGRYWGVLISIFNYIFRERCFASQCLSSKQ